MAEANVGVAVHEVGVSCLGRQEALPNDKSIWLVMFVVQTTADEEAEKFACDVAGMALLALRKSGRLSVGDGLLAFAVALDGVLPIYLAFVPPMQLPEVPGASDVRFPDGEVQKFFMVGMQSDRTGDKNHLAVKVSVTGSKITHASVYVVKGPLTVPPVDAETPPPTFKPVVYGTLAP